MVEFEMNIHLCVNEESMKHSKIIKVRNALDAKSAADDYFEKVMKDQFIGSKEIDIISISVARVKDYKWVLNQ